MTFYMVIFIMGGFSKACVGKSVEATPQNHWTGHTVQFIQLHQHSTPYISEQGCHVCLKANLGCSESCHKINVQ